MKNLVDMKNNVRTVALCLISVFVFSSCDSGFQELNTNPNVYTKPQLENIFSNSIVDMAGVTENGIQASDQYWTNFKYASGIVQYLTSLRQDELVGGKYLYTQNYNDAYFQLAYQYKLKSLNKIILEVKDDPNRVNLYAMARVLRVYTYQRLTDLYGDVPYTDANKGLTKGVLAPKYDKQSFIYSDMLSELKESASDFDSSKPTVGAADLIYQGNIQQWKRFAYSLMVRVAMRLTKVDPSMAKKYVKIAYQGGVMQNNADIAKLEHTNSSRISRNDGNYLAGSIYFDPSSKGHELGKVSSTFVKYLKKTQDPRISFFMTLWQGNADPSKIAQASAPGKQKGLPNGYDFSTISEAIPTWTNDAITQYSVLNLNTIGSVSAPTIFQSYAEVELLLSEAAARGWINANPKELYDKAETAAMEMVSIYPGNMKIDDNQISQFLGNNPFPTGGTLDDQLKLINDQYWVLHFYYDSIEAFANWRRSGYPKLKATNYAGGVTGGVIMRRLRYPQSEVIHNTENYKTAVASQGADLYTTRVWWDIKK